MKHVYPVRHPASLEATPQGATGSLPHERDESSASQASATPQQDDVARKAHDNATDGSADTDKAPVMDQVYNQNVAPGRGTERPRR